MKLINTTVYSLLAAALVFSGCGDPAAPRPPDKCLLPVDIGPCDGAFPRWAYDDAMRACVPFLYGGCEGNENNFETHAECMTECTDVVPRQCGTDAMLSCASDEYCDYHGDCTEPGSSGICRPRPEVCPLVHDPVCGCDNRTYSNACVAHMAGNDVLASGTCVAPKRCGTFAGLECDATEYCDYDESCALPDAGGTCRPRPDACITVFDPVCGCDRLIYGNECMAFAAGVDVLAEGLCEPVQTSSR